MNTNTLHDWTANLLSTARIPQPDGRPLYAYRCTSESFHELRRLLTGWNPRGQVGRRAFAVYAAEWWRRNYRGGPWTWQPLLESIRCDSPFQELYGPLRNAWYWWGVKPVVLGASVRYLGTCACQGGLPLHLVSSPNSNVRQFLRALLEEYRSFRSVVTDGYVLAEALRSYLPRSLRQEPVYRLGAEIMDQIWDLRDTVAQDRSDPVAVLDRQTPEWRTGMPIDLDDEQARGLIVSLFHRAVEPGPTTEQFRVIRYIADTSVGRSFVVEARVPRHMAAAALARMASVNELPARFQLRVDGAAPIPIANGRVAGDHVVFSNQLTEPEHLAALADKEIRWFIQSGGRIGESFAPRGSAAPADDLPWIFAAPGDHDARLDLYAEGSVRTRFPRVAVACRAETAGRLRSHSGCREWGVQPVAGRVMFDVEGDVELETPVGTCRVRTAQAEEQQYEHRLDGTPCLDVDAPLPVYRATPSVRVIEPDGKQRSVPSAQVSWRSARGDEWVRSPDPDQLGVWQVRRVVEGETVFLSTICLAGADFGVRIVPGRNPLPGFVDIRGALVDVACKEAEVDVGTEEHADGLRVTVQRANEPAERRNREAPPSHVVLATRWPNGSILPITVPFPGEGARFAHPVRGGADRQRGLSVQSLYGWRALAVSPKSSPTFRLVGELRADDLDHRMRGAACFDVALPHIGDGVSELPLIEVHDTLESLFATTKVLDARIVLELTSDGAIEARTVVHRFACDVEASNEGVYRVPSRRLPDQETPVAFEAFSLENPGLGRTPLEPAGEDAEPGSGRLPEAAFPHDTTVVLARRGDEHFARPFVNPSARPVPAKEAQSLAEAASIIDLEARVAAMSRILDRMVGGGGGDENWEYLWGLLDVSRGLPATTFDALDCLSDSPRALVQLVLRTPQEEWRARIWRLEHELPFSWLLVPLAVWREEMARTHRTITAELREIKILASTEVQQRAAERLRDVAAEAARACPAWGRGVEQVSLLDRFAEDAIHGSEAAPECELKPPAPRTFDELRRSDVYQALLQQGNDFRWPAGPDREDWAASVDMLNETAWRGIWLDCRDVGFRRPLSDAPFGAAFAAACGVRVPRRLVHATKLLRSHAPEWFDAAYAAVLAWILRVDRDSQHHD